MFCNDQVGSLKIRKAVFKVSNKKEKHLQHIQQPVVRVKPPKHQQEKDKHWRIWAKNIKIH